MSMNINKEKFSDASISQDLGKSGSAQVDLFNGNLTFVHTDVQFNYGNPIISVGHVYSAKAQSSGTYGNNWSLNCEEKIEIASDGSYLKYVDASGSAAYYFEMKIEAKSNYTILDSGIDTADKLYMPMYSGSSGVYKSGSEYILFDGKGNRKHYSVSGSVGYLSKVATVEGKKLVYTRNTSHLLTKIQDDNGRYVNFTYSGNKLTEVVDSAGRKKKYSYSNNNLTEIKNVSADGSEEICLTIEYGSNNLVARITGANGISYLYEYPNNSARVSKVTKQSKHKVISSDVNSMQTEENYTSYESWDITYNLDKVGISQDENGNDVVDREYDANPTEGSENNDTYAEHLNSKVVTNLGVTHYYGFKTDNGTYYYNALSYEGDKYKIGVAKDTMSIRTSQSSDRLVISTAKDNLLKNPNFDNTENDPVKGYYPMDWQGFYEGSTQNYVAFDAIDQTNSLIIPADGRVHGVYQSINNVVSTGGGGDTYNSLNGGMYTLSAWIKGGKQAQTKEFSLQVKYYNCIAETVPLTNYESLSAFGDDKWTYVIKSVYLPNTKQDSSGTERGIESIKVCINFKSTYTGNNNNLLIDRISLNYGKANVMKSEPVLVCKTDTGNVIYNLDNVNVGIVLGAVDLVNKKARWIQENLMVLGGNTIDIETTKVTCTDGSEFFLKNVRVMYNAINTTEDSFAVTKTENDVYGNPITQNLWNRGKEYAADTAFNVTKTFDNKYRELTSIDFRNVQTTTTYTDRTATVGEIITQNIKKKNQARDKAYEVSIEKTLDGSATAQETDAQGNTIIYDYKGNDTAELVKDVLYKTTYPDGSYVKYTYDKNGNVATMTLGKNTTANHTFAYTYTMGYPTKVIVDNSDTFTYDYDGMGNVKRIKKNGVELASYNYVYRYNAGLPPYKTTTKFGKSYTTEFDEYGNPASIYETSTIDLVSTMEYDPNTKECKKINDFTNTDRNSTPQTVWETETDSNKTVITASGRVNLENTVYQKDGLVSEEEMTVGNDEFYTKFEYDSLTSKGRYPDNRLENVYVKDGQGNLMAKTTYNYNNLSNISGKSISSVWDETTGTEENVINQTIGYTRPDNSNYIGDNVISVNTTLSTKDKTWDTTLDKKYTYDDKNNVTNIRYRNLFYNSMVKDEVDDTTVANGTHYEQTEYEENVSYVYDEHGKLIRENNHIAGKTFLYYYDTKGNILQRIETTYTTGEIPETAEEICYNYGYNSNGQLRYINYEPTGDDIIVVGNYDSYGNPHSYNGNTLSWDGQRLTAYGTTTYQYDMRGLRLSKTVNDVTTNYVYDTESRLVQETKGTQRINYLYNMNDMIGFTLPYTENGVTKQFPFYYIKDAQGNICYIVDKFGKLVVSYNYDAWGNVVNKFFFKYGVANAKTNYSITLGTTVYTAQDIDNLNSHYYRGYYYDKETGFYYLTTRYYDPKTGRFISPDDPKYLDFEVAYGHNRYAYCCNNPVMYADPEGHMPEWVQWIIGGIAVAGLAVATVLTCGVAGAGAAAVGAAMLAGGLISAGINVIDQLHDGGEFNWTELAISTLSGTAYGLVVGLTGGTGAWAVVGKFAVAGGTSLLNSWNENATFAETMISLGISLLVSGMAQGAGYGVGKGISHVPKDPTKFLTLGDIGSYLWSVPAVKTGVIRFAGGVMGSIFNDIF